MSKTSNNRRKDIKIEVSGIAWKIIIVIVLLIWTINGLVTQYKDDKNTADYKHSKESHRDINEDSLLTVLDETVVGIAGKDLIIRKIIHTESYRSILRRIYLLSVIEKRKIDVNGHIIRVDNLIDDSFRQNRIIIIKQRQVDLDNNTVARRLYIISKIHGDILNAMFVVEENNNKTNYMINAVDKNSQIIVKMDSKKRITFLKNTSFIDRINAEKHYAYRFIFDRENRQMPDIFFILSYDKKKDKFNYLLYKELDYIFKRVLDKDMEE